MNIIGLVCSQCVYQNLLWKFSMMIMIVISVVLIVMLYVVFQKLLSWCLVSGMLSSMMNMSVVMMCVLLCYELIYVLSCLWLSDVQQLIRIGLMFVCSIILSCLCSVGVMKYVMVCISGMMRINVVSQCVLVWCMLNMNSSGQN